MSESGVTVQVTTRPKPGREADYEQVVTAMLAEAAGFPGHRKSELSQRGGIFHVAFAFDTAEHYRAWETSPERHAWSRRLPDLLAESTEQRQLSGLDAWVIDPSAPHFPPRWKTAVVTWLGIFPTVVVLVVLVGLVIPADRFLLWGNLAVTSLCTLAMTYTVMPALTRLLGSWLRNP